MSEQQSRDEREPTAYHEAGHAVAYLELGIPIEEVTIIPNEFSRGRVKRPSSFLVDLVNQLHSGKRCDEQVLRALVTLFAGMASEARHATGSFPGSVRELLAEWQRLSDTVAASRILGLCDEPDTLRDESYRRVRELLHGSWRAVEEVAEALLESDELSPDRVREIVAGGRDGG